MSLAGAKLIRLDENGVQQGEAVLAKGRKLAVGYFASCDYVLEDDRAKSVHCEIQCDAFGRVTIHNFCQEHPICVNGEKVGLKRLLLNGARISILDQTFLWEFTRSTSQEQKVLPDTEDASTPLKQAVDGPEQPPNSCPDLRLHREIPKRLTVHNFAYCIQSDEEGNNTTVESPDTSSVEETSAKATDDMPQSVERRSITPEPQTVASSSMQLEVTPKMNLINSTQNKNNASTEKKQKLLSLCQQSDVVITSFSPRETGVRIEKSFTAILKPAATPKSVYSTPKSVLSDIHDDDGSNDCIDFSTPATSKKHLSRLARKNSSMYLIDLTTPSKLRPASPYLKSALKSSSAKKLGEKPSGSQKLTNFASVLEEDELGVRALPATPIAPLNDLSSDKDSHSSAESIISVNSTDLSVIVLSGDDGTPDAPISQPPTKTPTKSIVTKTAGTPMRTPQSLIKRALLASAKKQTPPRRNAAAAAAAKSATTPTRTATPVKAFSPISPKSVLKRSYAQRTGISTPTRTSLPMSRLERDSSPSSALSGPSTSLAAAAARRSSLNPLLGRTLPSSTPVGATRHSSLRLGTAKKISPLNKVRKLLGGTSHISKARKHIALPNRASPLTNPLALAKGSNLSRTPFKTRSKFVSNASPASMLQDPQSSAHKLNEDSKKAELFTDKQEPRVVDTVDLSCTFTLDSDDEGASGVDKQTRPNDVTFSPVKDATESKVELNKTFSPVKDSTERKVELNTTFSPIKDTMELKDKLNRTFSPVKDIAEVETIESTLDVGEVKPIAQEQISKIFSTLTSWNEESPLKPTSTPGKKGTQQSVSKNEVTPHQRQMPTIVINSPDVITESFAEIIEDSFEADVKETDREEPKSEANSKDSKNVSSIQLKVTDDMPEKVNEHEPIIDSQVRTNDGQSKNVENVKETRVVEDVFVDSECDATKVDPKEHTKIVSKDLIEPGEPFLDIADCSVVIEETNLIDQQKVSEIHSSFENINATTDEFTENAETKTDQNGQSTEIVETKREEANARIHKNRSNDQTETIEDQPIGEDITDSSLNIREHETQLDIPETNIDEENTVAEVFIKKDETTSASENSKVSNESLQEDSNTNVEEPNQITDKPGYIENVAEDVTKSDDLKTIKDDKNEDTNNKETRNSKDTKDPSKYTEDYVAHIEPNSEQITDSLEPSNIFSERELAESEENTALLKEIDDVLNKSDEMQKKLVDQKKNCVDKNTSPSLSDENAVSTEEVSQKVVETNKVDKESDEIAKRKTINETNAEDNDEANIVEKNTTLRLEAQSDKANTSFKTIDNTPEERIEAGILTEKRVETSAPSEAKQRDHMDLIEESVKNTNKSTPQTPNLRGMREMLRTPKSTSDPKTPRFAGLKSLLRTPKASKFNETECLDGVQSLLQTPHEKTDIEPSTSKSCAKQEQTPFTPRRSARRASTDTAIADTPKRITRRASYAESVVSTPLTPKRIVTRRPSIDAEVPTAQHNQTTSSKRVVAFEENIEDMGAIVEEESEECSNLSTEQIAGHKPSTEDNVPTSEIIYEVENVLMELNTKETGKNDNVKNEGEKDICQDGGQNEQFKLELVQQEGITKADFIVEEVADDSLCEIIESSYQESHSPTKELTSAQDGTVVEIFESENVATISNRSDESTLSNKDESIAEILDESEYDYGNELADTKETGNIKTEISAKLEPTTPKTSKTTMKVVATPKTPLMVGMRELLKTPRPAAQTPRLAGLRDLVRTPPRVCSTPLLSGIKELMNTPIMETPISRVAKVSFSELKNDEADNSNVLNLNETVDESLDKFFRTPRAKNIMIPTLPPSAVIEKSTDSVELVHSTEYDLNDTNAGTANLEDIFKTPVASRFDELITESINVEDNKDDTAISVATASTSNATAVTEKQEKQNLSAEEAFDQMIGQPNDWSDNRTPVRSVYTRKTISTPIQPHSPFSVADVISDLPKTDIQEWVDSLEDVDLLNDEDDDFNEKLNVTADDELEVTMDPAGLGDNQNELSRDPLAASCTKRLINTCKKDEASTSTTTVSEILLNVSTVSSCIPDPLSSCSGLKTLSSSVSNIQTLSVAEENSSEIPLTPLDSDMSGIDLLDQTAESVFSEALLVSDTDSFDKTLEISTKLDTVNDNDKKSDDGIANEIEALDADDKDESIEALVVSGSNSSNMTLEENVKLETSILSQTIKKEDNSNEFTESLVVSDTDSTIEVTPTKIKSIVTEEKANLTIELDAATDDVKIEISHSIEHDSSIKVLATEELTEENQVLRDEISKTQLSEKILVTSNEQAKTTKIETPSNIITDSNFDQAAQITKSVSIQDNISEIVKVKYEESQVLIEKKSSSSTYAKNDKNEVSENAFKELKADSTELALHGAKIKEPLVDPSSSSIVVVDVKIEGNEKFDVLEENRLYSENTKLTEVPVDAKVIENSIKERGTTVTTFDFEIKISENPLADNDTSDFTNEKIPLKIKTITQVETPIESINDHIETPKSLEIVQEIVEQKSGVIAEKTTSRKRVRKGSQSSQCSANEEEPPNRKGRQNIETAIQIITENETEDSVITGNESAHNDQKTEEHLEPLLNQKGNEEIALELVANESAATPSRVSRTRKPTVRAQQFLEELRAKADTPSKKRLLLVSAESRCAGESTTTTPKRTPARRGRMPSNDVIEILGNHEQIQDETTTTQELPLEPVEAIEQACSTDNTPLRLRTRKGSQSSQCSTNELDTPKRRGRKKVETVLQELVEDVEKEGLPQESTEATEETKHIDQEREPDTSKQVPQKRGRRKATVSESSHSSLISTDEPSKHKDKHKNTPSENIVEEDEIEKTVPTISEELTEQSTNSEEISDEGKHMEVTSNDVPTTELLENTITKTRDDRANAISQTPTENVDAVSTIITTITDEATKTKSTENRFKLKVCEKVELSTSSVEEFKNTSAENEIKTVRNEIATIEHLTPASNVEIIPSKNLQKTNSDEITDEPAVEKSATNISYDFQADEINELKTTSEEQAAEKVENTPENSEETVDEEIAAAIETVTEEKSTTNVTADLQIAETIKNITFASNVESTPGNVQKTDFGEIIKTNETFTDDPADEKSIENVSDDSKEIIQIVTESEGEPAAKFESTRATNDTVAAAIEEVTEEKSILNVSADLQVIETMKQLTPAFNVESKTAENVYQTKPDEFTKLVEIVADEPANEKLVVNISHDFQIVGEKTEKLTVENTFKENVEETVGEEIAEAIKTVAEEKSAMNVSVDLQVVKTIVHLTSSCKVESLPVENVQKTNHDETTKTIETVIDEPAEEKSMNISNDLPIADKRTQELIVSNEDHPADKAEKTPIVEESLHNEIVVELETVAEEYTDESFKINASKDCKNDETNAKKLTEQANNQKKDFTEKYQDKPTTSKQTTELTAKLLETLIDTSDEVTSTNAPTTDEESVAAIRKVITTSQSSTNEADTSNEQQEEEESTEITEIIAEKPTIVQNTQPKEVTLESHDVRKIQKTPTENASEKLTAAIDIVEMVKSTETVSEQHVEVKSVNIDKEDPRDAKTNFIKPITAQHVETAVEKSAIVSEEQVPQETLAQEYALEHEPTTDLTKHVPQKRVRRKPTASESSESSLLGDEEPSTRKVRRKNQNTPAVNVSDKFTAAIGIVETVESIEAIAEQHVEENFENVDTEDPRDDKTKPIIAQDTKTVEEKSATVTQKQVPQEAEVNAAEQQAPTDQIKHVPQKRGRRKHTAVEASQSSLCGEEKIRNVRRKNQNISVEKVLEESIGHNENSDVIIDAEAIEVAETVESTEIVRDHAEEEFKNFETKDPQDPEAIVSELSVKLDVESVEEPIAKEQSTTIVDSQMTDKTIKDPQKKGQRKATVSASSPSSLLGDTPSKRNIRQKKATTEIIETAIVEAPEKIETVTYDTEAATHVSQTLPKDESESTAEALSAHECENQTNDEIKPEVTTAPKRRGRKKKEATIEAVDASKHLVEDNEKLVKQSEDKSTVTNVKSEETESATKPTITRRGGRRPKVEPQETAAVAKRRIGGRGKKAQEVHHSNDETKEEQKSEQELEELTSISAAIEETKKLIHKSETDAIEDEENHANVEKKSTTKQANPSKRGGGRKKKVELDAEKEQIDADIKEGEMAETKEESVKTEDILKTAAPKKRAAAAPRLTRKASALEVERQQLSTQDGTPSQSINIESPKRTTPRRAAAAHVHNYDESSDTETTTAATSTRKPPANSDAATTSRGRTRKPIAHVLQFLEEERAKTVTPSKRRLLLATEDEPVVITVTPATPKRMPARRGRKPSTIETPVVLINDTPSQVITPKAPSQRGGRTRTALAAEIHPEEVSATHSSTERAEDTHSSHAEEQELLALPAKGRKRIARKATTAKMDDKEVQEPPTKKSPQLLASEKEDAAIDVIATPQSAAGGRRKLKTTTAVTAAVEDDPPVESTKSGRGGTRRVTAKTTSYAESPTTVIATTDVRNSDVVEEKPKTSTRGGGRAKAKAATSKRRDRKNSATVDSSAENENLQKESDVVVLLNDEEEDEPLAQVAEKVITAATKRVATTAALKAVVDSPATKRSRRKIVEDVETAPLMTSSDSTAPLSGAGTTGRARRGRNVRFESTIDLASNLNAAASVDTADAKTENDVAAAEVAAAVDAPPPPVKRATRTRRN